MPREALIASHGLSHEQVDTLSARGVGLGGLLSLLISLGSAAPQVIAFIKALLAGLQKPNGATAVDQAQLDALKGEHGLTGTQVGQLQSAGLDIGALLQLLRTLGAIAPQVIALIQQILDAFKTSDPVPPAPVPK